MSFAAIHRPGDPLILFNIWDAGSARAIADAGAVALATGSASVAGAMGFADGQELPFDLLVDLAARIASASDLPLSVDFEAGYADNPADVAENAARLEETGVAGINLEDGIPPENGVRSIEEQARLIEAIDQRTSLFINARTDLFLQNSSERHASLVADALERAAAFNEAGADGFFVPGLVDLELIREICGSSPLPVNVMKSPSSPRIADLADAGVARISFGPFPWRDSMTALARAFQEQTARS
ncbi:isocitrate lyase/PEP mutase family protein [Paracoccus aerodenitrificans]|uniref:isocitrate lyase/PEP mutase family protein n=1 Tax=Paracoccus aerodenitrificans TaxID=3017781 RepID=UPI0022EFF62E|nr:isocitrate lyase/phosphoenolpyruvate mutase family protein [Paracoccus aerodenitrificans]WBU63245.1 isocitrate lyase/phosphoenolpyruvate mutase family protein [Paracoccus aerodenitrificans]